MPPLSGAAADTFSPITRVSPLHSRSRLDRLQAHATIKTFCPIFHETTKGLKVARFIKQLPRPLFLPEKLAGQENESVAKSNTSLSI